MYLLSFLLTNILFNYNFVYTKHFNKIGANSSNVQLFSRLNTFNRFNKSSVLVNNLNINFNSNNYNENGIHNKSDIIDETVDQLNTAMNDSVNESEGIDDNDYNYDDYNSDNESEEQSNVSLLSTFLDQFFENDNKYNENETLTSLMLANNSNKVFEVLYQSYNNGVNVIQALHKQISVRLFEKLSVTAISAECMAALAVTNDALNSRQLWALQSKHTFKSIISSKIPQIII
jgi:hypothetical protein